MIKIIIASTVPTSLNTFCKGLLKELSNRYEIIGLSSPGEDLEIVSNREGVRTIAIPMERHVSLLRDIVSLYRLIKVFRKERPTMVHSMTPKAGLLCMVSAFIAGVPERIHTFTGLVWPTSTGIKRTIIKITDRITCACATHIIPEGEGVKHDLYKGRITKKSLKVLGYGNVRGIDLGFYCRSTDVENKASSLRDNTKFTFLFVGRIVRDKGINELLRAFRDLNNRTHRLRLYLVGPYEESLDPISEESKQIINSSPDIICTGTKKGIELLAYYAASDCYVFPSYREGFPNTVLEAGAMGLPCIVTDINGSREIITNGFNGLVIPPKNETALYEAMSIMLENDEERERMSALSRSRIIERYDQNYVRQCLYNYYEDILKTYV